MRNPAAKRIPGTRDDGTINTKKLKDWIVEVLSLCKKFGRLAVGEHAIGHLLAKCKPGTDGIWPSEPIREVLEEVGTTEIASTYDHKADLRDSDANICKRLPY